MNAKDFEKEEPFPEGLKTAELETLSLAKIQDAEEAETKRLFDACKAYGFFYLNLEDSDTGMDLLDSAARMFHFSEGLFNLPEDEKSKYDLKGRGSFYGYKGVGGSVVDRKGTLDRMEAWNLGKDDVMQSGPENPNPYISMTLIGGLERELGMEPETLTKLHNFASRSGDQIRFIKCFPQLADDRSTALGEHTDFGSITVLFNRIAGLRIVEPEIESSYDDWPWVRPKPGHAIINVGDALVKFTNGLFRSNIHRVDPPPSNQASSVRYSLGYFSRPADDVVLNTIKGYDTIPPLDPGQVEEERTSKDWLLSRFMGRRVGVFKGPEHWDTI